MIVPLLFFCSGATALIYEVVWSKYLALIFGSTVQAQTVVLAVFMGGLALGNRLFGRRADTATGPLAVYGYIEVTIGLYAFFFPQFFELADALFVRLGQGRLDQAVLLFGLKAALAIGLLLGPTVLMGGTLPLLATWLQRRYPDGGRWSARFYSINSLGAVFGSGVAGFLLVRALGLVSALQMTAFANVLLGFAAVGVSRYAGELGPLRRGDRERSVGGPSGAPTPTPASVVADAVAPEGAAGSGAGIGAGTGGGTGTGKDLGAVGWGCVFVAMSGAISMGLEVLAARSLVLIFGASLQAFAIVLMAFILGIGIGGGVIASLRWKGLSREGGTIVLMLVAAGVLAVLVLGIERWVLTYLHAKSGLAPTEMGFRYHQLLAAAMSMVVLGLPAGLLGAILPLWIRGLGEAGEALGDRVGRLLTANTLGAVAGVLITGFGLMPGVGLRGAFFVLVGVMCVVALAAAFASGRRVAGAVAALMLAAVGVAGFTTGEGWKQVLSSGVFRVRGAEIDPQMLENRKKHIEILFYEDAADATVSVEKVVGLKHMADIGLRINGKVDASSRVDLATQYLLAHLPMLARPEARDAFVLGLGSGVTAGALLGHPLDQVVIAENCGPVLRAAGFFAEWNRGVLTNRIARFWKEDARTVLKLSPQRYDVLISEPSNPWMAGIGSVFSREFYELAASRLKDGGVMAQWFHIYEMSDPIVGLVLRTFSSVFPFVEIWDPGSGDIIMLGSRQPWKSDPAAFHAVFDRPEAHKDFEAIGIRSPEALWSRQLASQRTAWAIADAGPLQSDYFPILEYEAPKAFYLGASSQVLNQFDERTWQQELGPPIKKETLSALDDAALTGVFAQFSSVNPYLNDVLRRRLRAGAARSASDVYTGRRLMPCVFRNWTEGVVMVLGGNEPDERLRRMWDQELLLRSSPTHAAAAAQAMLELLAGYRADGDPVAARAASDFAATAFRVAYGRGDADLARRLLIRGLEIEPGSPELRYFARIVDRESGRPGP